MTGQITIRFVPGEGTIARIVTLVERRGFILSGLAMHEQGDTASITLDLVARDASRRFDVLDLQLKRIIGVTSVSIPTGSVQ